MDKSVPGVLKWEKNRLTSVGFMCLKEKTEKNSKGIFVWTL